MTHKKATNESFYESVNIDFIELDKLLEKHIEHGCIYVRHCVPVWGVHKSKRFVLAYINR